MEFCKKYTTGLLMMLAMIFLGGTAAAQSGRTCTELLIPAPTANVPDAVIYGELCRPSAGDWPSTVEVLVHGTFDTHQMFDMRHAGGTYSHVRMALGKGRATLAIDRLGTGQSTLPLSFVLASDDLVQVNHALAVKLRNGTICGGACDAPAFQKLVLISHSLSAAVAWEGGRTHPNDYDAYVTLGLVHGTSFAFLGNLQATAVPANTDPHFQDVTLDDGYITTDSWTRHLTQTNPNNMAPSIEAQDELAKGFASAPMTFATAGRYVFDPKPCSDPTNDTPSCVMTKPAFVIVGDMDQPSCTGPGALSVCTEQSVLAFESPFYSQAANLQVKVIPNAGHGSPREFGYEEAYDWLDVKLQALGM